jgi:hypothetical protein
MEIENNQLKNVFNTPNPPNINFKHAHLHYPTVRQNHVTQTLFCNKTFNIFCNLLNTCIQKTVAAKYRIATHHHKKGLHCILLAQKIKIKIQNFF